MLQTLIAVFVILHGLVHLLYLGQGVRKFELRPGLLWPDDAWIRPMGSPPESTRQPAAAFCLIAAAGFIASGIGTLVGTGWAGEVRLGSAAFSSLVYIMFWNGRFEHLADQGGIGLIINAALMLTALTVG